jgi:hypothetical protein
MEVIVGFGFLDVVFVELAENPTVGGSRVPVNLRLLGQGISGPPAVQDFDEG